MARRTPRDGSLVEFTLPAPRQFDFSWLCDFLGTRALSPIEYVEDGVFTRSLRFGSRTAAVAVRVDGAGRGRRVVRVRAVGSVEPACLRAAVGRMFDLDAPVGEFLRLAAADRYLRRVVARRPGIRLPVYHDPFEALIRAILGQQVSLSAARTLGERLVRRCGDPCTSIDGRPLHAFPRPAAVAALSVSAIRALGVTRAKASSIRSAAVAVREGRLDLGRLRMRPSTESDATLRALPGIGGWTSAYVRLRGFGDRDAFLPTDLGVVKALARWRIAPGLVDLVTDRWRPWRGYATLHLWSSLAERPGSGDD